MEYFIKKEPGISNYIYFLTQNHTIFVILFCLLFRKRKYLQFD